MITSEEVRKNHITAICEDLIFAIKYHNRKNAIEFLNEFMLIIHQIIEDKTVFDINDFDLDNLNFQNYYIKK